MATQQDLATQTMQELGLLDANETPTAADALIITTKYAQRFVMLSDEDYADWDIDAIPDAAMPGLIRVMAYECGPTFLRPRSGMVEPGGQTWEEKGLSMLRRYLRQKPTYEPTRADYF